LKDFYDSIEFKEHSEEMEALLDEGDIDDEDILDSCTDYLKIKKDYEDRQPDWYKKRWSMNYDKDHKDAFDIYLDALKHDCHPSEYEEYKQKRK